MKCRLCGKKLVYLEECSGQWSCPDWRTHENAPIEVNPFRQDEMAMQDKMAAEDY